MWAGPAPEQRIWCLEGTPVNILLVDDYHESRRRMAQFMRHFGHRVVETGNGHEALDAFDRQHFHLVMTDVRMPKMDGLELLHRVRSRRRAEEVDVVLFSAHADREAAEEARLSGASAFLVKPVAIRELVAVLQQAEHKHACLEGVEGR